MRRREYDRQDAALRSQITALLEEAFGRESRHYYELMLEHLYDRDHAFLLCEGEQPVSIAVVVDYLDEEGGRWGYLYSLATDRAYRAQGWMTRLYRETIEPALRRRGYRGVCLVPAGRRLVSYYEGWGLRLMTVSPEEQRLQLVPGPQATAYLRAAYGTETICNPLPLRMCKSFDPAVREVRLTSPLD